MRRPMRPTFRARLFVGRADAPALPAAAAPGEADAVNTHTAQLRVVPAQPDGPYLYVVPDHPEQPTV